MNWNNTPTYIKFLVKYTLLFAYPFSLWMFFLTPRQLSVLRNHPHRLQPVAFAFSLSNVPVKVAAAFAFFFSQSTCLCLWPRVALQLSDKMPSIFCHVFDLYEFRVLEIWNMCRAFHLNIGQLSPVATRGNKPKLLFRIPWIGWRWWRMGRYSGCIVQSPGTLNWHTWMTTSTVFFQLAKLLRWSTINFSSIPGSDQNKYTQSHWPLNVNKPHTLTALSICELNNNNNRAETNPLLATPSTSTFQWPFSLRSKGALTSEADRVVSAICCTLYAALRK